MKGMLLGVLGVGAAGTAVVYGGVGAPAIDDYVGVVHKAPERVYAAFSALGPEGETRFPTRPGKPSLVQRITKVPNQNVKLEYLLDGEHLLSAEVQVAPAEGGATQLAAEFDLNVPLVQQLTAEAGGMPMPPIAFAEPIMDQAFGMAMGEMVRNIEAGRSLPSFAETRARWGSETAGHSGGRASPTASPGWRQPEAVRPQVDPRPAVDPNRPHSSGGW